MEGGRNHHKWPLWVIGGCKRVSAAGPAGIQLRKCVSTLKDQRSRASPGAGGERPDLRQPFAEL